MASYSLRQMLMAGVAVAAVVAAIIWWFVASRPQVTAVKPTRGDAAEVVYATGVVEPQQWAKVSSLQRKRIVEHCNCEGKAVKRGDVLARLDDGAERALLRELEARRERIQEEAQRLEGLVERNVTTRVTYDEKLTQLREQDARIAAQKDRISDLVLRAPMDGVVLRRDGEVGEIAGINATDILFWVGQPKPLRVVAEVNEEDIIKTRLGRTCCFGTRALPARRCPRRLSEHHAERRSVDQDVPRLFRASRRYAAEDRHERRGQHHRPRGEGRAAGARSRRSPTATCSRFADGRAYRVAVKTGIRGARMVEVLVGPGRAIDRSSRRSTPRSGMAARVRVRQRRPRAMRLMFSISPSRMS